MKTIQKLQSINSNDLVKILKNHQGNISASLRYLGIHHKHAKARATFRFLVLSADPCCFDNRRRGKRNTYTISQLTEACKISICYEDLKKALNLTPHGSNNVALKRMIEREEIDISHFDRSKARVMNRKGSYTFEEIFCKNSEYPRSSLAIKAKNLNIFKYECQKCHLGEIWNGAVLKMQLDHINSISNDNRIENLRWLCPNCHTQTENYAGKRTNKRVVV